MEGIGAIESGPLTAALSGQNVDKQAFLNLLVTQLKNQDPFEPLENEAFLAQLATFSQLEEAQSTNQLLGNLIQVNQADLALGGLAQGASLVGKTVEYVDPETGAQVRGTVYSVFFDPSGVLVEVDRRIIPAGSIVTISTEAPANPAIPAGTTPGATPGNTAPSNPSVTQNQNLTSETNGTEG